MKQRLPLILTVCVSTIFSLLLSQAMAAGPKIHVEEEEFDFGTIEEGEKVTHEFAFKNTGTADLVITDVKTSCGCTAAVSSAKTIPPGKSGSIKTTFDSSRRRGAQNKTIVIVSNDPDNPRASVRLTGKVAADDQPEIRVFPMPLDMGVLEPGKPATQVITITNMGSADLILEDFVGRPHVSVKDLDKFKKKTLKPQEFVKIEVVADPQNLQGIFQGYLKIENNTPQRTLTVPVYGYVSNKYMLKPEYGKHTGTAPDQ